MRLTFTTLLCAALLALSTNGSAGLLDKEITFSEAEVQAALARNTQTEMRYPGLLAVSLRETPTIRLGVPEGRAGISARMEISLLGNPPMPVAVKGNAGIRYDDQAKAFFLENPTAESVESIALFDASWHEGVVGILASRIKDQLHRPVFAFAPGEGGIVKGSGRSIPGLHLRDALDLVAKRAPGLLLRFGGHAMAAGATLRAEDFGRFRDLFAEIAGELLDSADLTRTLETDGALEGGYISLETARLLENEVWGQGFPAPLFLDEFEVEQQRGLKEKHLKLRLKKGNARFEAIQFNFTAQPGNRTRLAFRLSVNEYMGVETPQLMIEHID